MGILNYVGLTHNEDGEESANAAYHRRALEGSTNGFGRALRKMLEGWEAYGKAHSVQYGEHIGHDHVIGDYWAEVGLAIKRLLDGNTGGWDCGSLAHNITQAITDVGIETDGYNVTDKEDK